MFTSLKLPFKIRIKTTVKKIKIQHKLKFTTLLLIIVTLSLFQMQTLQLTDEISHAKITNSEHLKKQKIKHN